MYNAAWPPAKDNTNTEGTRHKRHAQNLHLLSSLAITELPPRAIRAAPSHENARAPRSSLLLGPCWTAPGIGFFWSLGEMPCKVREQDLEVPTGAPTQPVSPLSLPLPFPLATNNWLVRRGTPSLDWRPVAQLQMTLLTPNHSMCTLQWVCTSLRFRVKMVYIACPQTVEENSFGT